MMMIKDKIYTVQQAAKELELTDGRVRQICRWNNIGTKQGRDWLLSESDMELLRDPEKRRQK